MINYLIHLLRNYDIWVKDNRKEQGFKVNSWWVVLWSLKIGFKSGCGQHLYLLLSHSNAGNTVEMSWLLILLFALNLFPMFNRTTTARQMFPTMVPISYGSVHYPIVDFLFWIWSSCMKRIEQYFMIVCLSR